MKTIYAKDIKVMQLTEEELEAIGYFVNDLNKKGYSVSLNLALQYGTFWQAEKDGIVKMLKHFAKKTIKATKINDFEAVCKCIAQALGTSSYNVARWLKGMRETFYIADQFGQNYIEIK